MERSGLRKISSNGPLNQFYKLQVLVRNERKELASEASVL